MQTAQREALFWVVGPFRVALQSHSPGGLSFLLSSLKDLLWQTKVCPQATNKRTDNMGVRRCDGTGGWGSGEGCVNELEVRHLCVCVHAYVCTCVCVRVCDTI